MSNQAGGVLAVLAEPVAVGSRDQRFHQLSVRTHSRGSRECSSVQLCGEPAGGRRAGARKRAGIGPITAATEPVFVPQAGKP